MPDCFVSYAHRPLDEAACRAVVACLARHDIAHWSDRALVARDGAALNAEIAAALDTARVVIFLASSQSMASPYCRAEVVRALEADTPVLRVDVEPSAVPPELLPLVAAPRLVYDPDHGGAAFEAALVAALAALGVAPGPRAGEEAVLALLDRPDASIVRPPYVVLRRGTPDMLAAYARRLTTAASLAPHNGYTHLSLALLSLAQRDVPRALAAALRAAELLPREPDAQYAAALARCAAIAPPRRGLADVEAILRQLAVARHLPRAGAHVDLLSALVVAGYYGPAYLTPPAAPDDLLRRGLSRPGRDVGECRRVLDTEPMPARPFAPDAALIEAYLVAA
jgi:hypothetical protein